MTPTEAKELAARIRRGYQTTGEYGMTYHRDAVDASKAIDELVAAATSPSRSSGEETGLSERVRRYMVSQTSPLNANTEAPITVPWSLLDEVRSALSSRATEGETWNLTRAVSALENWGRHHPWCRYIHHQDTDDAVVLNACNCGFDEILQALRSPQSSVEKPSADHADLVKRLEEWRDSVARDVAFAKQQLSGETNHGAALSAGWRSRLRESERCEKMLTDAIRALSSAERGKLVIPREAVAGYCCVLNQLTDDPATKVWSAIRPERRLAVDTHVVAKADAIEVAPEEKPE